MNNIGAFTIYIYSILSEFSAGYAGKVKKRHLLWNADGSQCPWCSGDSRQTTAHVPNAPHLNVQCVARYMKSEEFLSGSLDPGL